MKVPESSEQGTVELTLEVNEARFLLAQLKRHAVAVEDELVHTEQRALQRDLAEDTRRIRRIAKELERLLG